MTPRAMIREFFKGGWNGAMPFTSYKFLNEWTDVGAVNDIYIDGSDIVYLLDGAARTVCRYTMEGAVISRWGDEGAEPGQFADPPHGFCVDSHGDMYVCEVPFLESRLQKYKKID